MGPSMRYEDFVIQIGSPRDDAYPVSILSSPAGEGAGRFRLPFDNAQVEGARRAFRGAARGTQIHPNPACEPGGPGVKTLGDLGGALFRSLFDGEVRSLYDQSLGKVSERPNSGLRIKLKLDPREPELARLAGLPWEYLCREETGDFLSLSRLTPVVRYLDVPRSTAPITVRPPLRILVVFSSPSAMEPLDLEKERENIGRACGARQGVEIDFLEQPDSSSLRSALLAKTYHALHFMGHGGFDSISGEGVLYFCSPNGGAEPVSGRELATRLKDIPSLGLIFLNACETARFSAQSVSPYSGVATALVLGGVRAVVAMQFPISDRAAIAFSTTFYQRLSTGDPLDAAMAEGRQAVLSAAPDLFEWGTPVLFLRVPDATVFTPQVSAYRRFLSRRSWLAAGVLATGLGLIALTTLQHLRGRPASESLASSFRMDIGQRFVSSLEGLSGELTRVEMLGNGRMRLFLQFRNRSGKPVGVGFDYQATYLADERGNRYRVLGADSGTLSAETAVDPLAPGASLERWIEVSSPKDRAQTFKVALKTYDSSAFTFPLFDLKLPTYPPELSAPAAAASKVEAKGWIPVEATLGSSVRGLTGKLLGVRQEVGRMRWSFSFLNQTAQDQPVSFSPQKTFLEDEYGYRYQVLEAYYDGIQGAYSQGSIQAAVRADCWFEFSLPQNGARNFRIVIGSRPGGTTFSAPKSLLVPGLGATSAQASVPKALGPISEPSNAAPEAISGPPARQGDTEESVASTSAPPAPAPAATPSEQVVGVQSVGRAMDVNLPGLRIVLQEVQRLKNGRLRWVLELENQSPGELALNLDYGKSYLSDDRENLYRALDADSSAGAEGVLREALAPGSRTRHWLDFSGPAKSAKRFSIILVGPEHRALATLFKVELSPL